MCGQHIICPTFVFGGMARGIIPRATMTQMPDFIAVRMTTADAAPGST